MSLLFLLLACSKDAADTAADAWAPEERQRARARRGGIDAENTPNIETEISWRKLGPIEQLTIPGELLPELAIGGYDGSAVGTATDEIIDPDNEPPPT
jgi:hypothetical protein